MPDDAGADALGRHRHRRRDRRAREHLPVHRGEGDAADAGGRSRRRARSASRCMATTFSLVAIFAPVGFMSGMVGRFMQSFGLTMAFAVHGVAVRELHADADDVGPLAEGEAADRPPTHDSKHSMLFGPLDRAYTRLLEWAMAASRHRRGGGRAGARCRACRSSASSTSTSRRWTISRSSTSPCARPKDRAWRRPRSSPTAWPRQSGGFTEVDYTMVTVAGDTAGTLNTASVFVRLKSLDERDARSAGRDGRGPQRRAAARDQGRRARRRAGVRRSGWRRRRHPVRAAGPAPRRPRALQRGAAREGRADSRSRRCRHDAEPGQARAVRCTSTGRRQPTSASRSAMPPKRCDCSSAATP